MDRFSGAFLRASRAFKIGFWILFILSAAVALVVFAQHQDDFLLNNREIASIFWLMIALIWILTVATIRQSLRVILKVVAGPKILIPFTIMTLWIIGLLGLAYHVDAWTPTIISEPVTWFVGTALGLFLNVPGHLKDEHFISRAALSVFGFGVFVELLMNVYVFTLPIELVLQPVLVVLTTSSAVAALKTEHKPAKVLCDWILTVIGFSIALYVIYRLVGNWREIDLIDELRRIIIPIWLTIGILPFIYLLSVYAAYDDMFIWVNHSTDDWRKHVRAKLALVLSFRVRPHESSGFNVYWAKQLTQASTLQESRAIVQQFRDSRR